MKEYWTALASLMGAFAFLQGVLHAVFPAELRAAVARLLGRVTRAFSPYCYFDVTEMDGMGTNEIYDAVQLYLSSTAAPAAGARLSLSRPPNASSFTFGLAASDRVVDTFRDAAVTWEHVVAPRQGQGFSWRPLPEEKRRFTLRIRRGDRDKLLPAYLDHILVAAADIRRRSQDRLLYTNARGGAMDARGLPWDPVPFKHPSTFETLAMDPARKAAIMADLRDFADGSAFYERTGRAWKRGYLLYGPPGTGKSSMIAAMGNYLGYDVYDLELTEVGSNAELRKLLMKTTSKSIIVIEDIDCSVDLTNRAATPPAPKLRPNIDGTIEHDGGAGTGRSITLSGLLNFTDGLWSCCGAERIFVFTTNHIEKLDPALLRSGRMDMHIFMSYCTFPALKILLKNYLGFQGDELDLLGDSDDGAAVMRGLEEWIDAAEITPADVSEVLIKNRRNGKKEAMQELLDTLKVRAEKRRRDGFTTAVVRKEGGGDNEEEEEKRALESPNEGKEQAGIESCRDGQDEETEAKKQV
ncbi:AAA-ATPase At4g25835-like [Phragmites australis]|uniref:AAA-ATPase At4g25835-like n=1 Tax=Phragmites australis TaxID=29695 RepID=UPI002D796C39|nr:AAA-ATPase At4g25835-like [Phragmites australis]